MREKEYTLRLHWKQGDDFADELEKADTVSEALRSWAERFERNAEHCRKLADEFDGEGVEAEPAVHQIELVEMPSPQHPGLCCLLSSLL